jgi:hypothetical protein
VSSVLIGIIGVALFIGIAVGGAVFLGPQFERSQDSAVSERVVANLSEIATGINNARLSANITGGQTLATPFNLMQSGFLTQVPEVPAGRGFVILDASGVDASHASDPNAWSPRYVALSVVDDQGLCTMIERKAQNLPSGSQVPTGTSSFSSLPNRPAGCFRDGVAMQNIAAGDYVAYVQI